MCLHMSAKARNEYIQLKKKRYRLLSGKKPKSQILNEAQKTTGYSRKHLIRMFSSSRRVSTGSQSGRPRKLSESEIIIVKDIWLASEQPCGKRLKPLLAEWLPFYPKCLPAQSRNILSCSAATLDRILAPFKVQSSKARKLSTAQRSIQAQIPIRRGPWEVSECGWLEADTVAHCGGSLRGSFLWTLTLTDIHSGWSELGATWNKGQESVTQAFQLIFNRLPFSIKGIDTDNGSEFLNHHLQRYWKHHPDQPQITRSRPNHKNDNAHVEERNRKLVREFIGYERLDQPEYVPILDDIYEDWCLLHNHFIPMMKLTQKQRVGSRVIKLYDRPQTPYQRVMRSNLPTKEKRKLKAVHRTLNPFELKARYESKLRAFYQYIQEKNSVQTSL